MAVYDYITSTGVIIPDTSDTLATVVDEFRTGLGQDLVVTNDTPQGVMIAMEVEGRDSVARNNGALANQINPDIAGGVFLDAIGALTRSSRRPATRSVIYGARLGGVPGSIIPPGSRVRIGQQGSIFTVIAQIIIADSGFSYADLQAVDYGPIAAAPAAVDTIVDGALGWETVINLTAAQPGRLLESDAAYRRRRRQTLARQGNGTPAAIQSYLMDIETVLSHTFRENVESFAQVIDGVSLKPHSIWVCVDGGTNDEIANALFSSKSGGCGWNGEITIMVVEPISGQSYLVQFSRPSQVNLSVRVTARFNNLDGQNIIKDALIQYANGELGGDEGFVVGASIYPFELAGAINQVEPRIVVAGIEVSTDSGATWVATPIILSIQQVARLSRDNIQVIPV